jgi:CTP synthase
MKYRDILHEKGMVFGGINPESQLVEAIELPVKEHPFFIAVQYHPEFKSRPTHAHPIFRDFITAAMKSAKKSGK